MRARAARRRPAADDQLPRARSRVRPRLRAERGAAGRRSTSRSRTRWASAATTAACSSAAVGVTARPKWAVVALAVCRGGVDVLRRRARAHGRRLRHGRRRAGAVGRPRRRARARPALDRREGVLRPSTAQRGSSRPAPYRLRSARSRAVEGRFAAGLGSGTSRSGRSRAASSSCCSALDRRLRPASARRARASTTSACASASSPGGKRRVRDRDDAHAGGLRATGCRCASPRPRRTRAGSTPSRRAASR